MPVRRFVLRSFFAPHPLATVAFEAAKKVDLWGLKGRLGARASWRKSVPQRLKPHCKCATCGTAEAVPLSKTDFFSTL